MQQSPIPSFLLYGEELSGTPQNFVHIETIAARSALYNWEILPHRHLHSLQALLVSKGHVEYRCDGNSRSLDAPCYVVIPVGSVHGFRFSPETSGYVLSLSSGFASRAVDAADPLLHLMTHGGSNPIAKADRKRVEWLCAEMLAIQSDWFTPQPLSLALAEALLRSLSPEPAHESALPPESERMSAFRRLIELHLREHHSVAWYADKLGTTGKTLTRACRQQLECTPTELIHARLVLEAQRLLRFTNASVVQVAGDLGFSDPSYFSRFYLRMTGRRPQMDKAGGRKSAPALPGTLSSRQ